MFTSDILCSIFTYLTAQETLTASLTCKRWRRIANMDRVTRTLFPVLPNQVREGLIMPTKGRGYDHDIVVLTPSSDGDINAYNVWKNYFPDYPKLSGNLARNYQLIHNHVYPEIYMRAAVKTYIDLPIPNYKYPRPDLIRYITERKILAEPILACKNLAEVNILFDANRNPYLLGNILSIFHNTPRKAKIIPQIIGNKISSNNDNDNDISNNEYYFNDIDQMVTDEVLWEGYEDPDYNSDLKDFFSQHSNLVNWTKDLYDDIGGSKIPYSTSVFNQQFVLDHPHLWHMWDWKLLREWVTLDIEAKKQIRKNINCSQIRKLYPKVIL